MTNYHPDDRRVKIFFLRRLVRPGVYHYELQPYIQVQDNADQNRDNPWMIEPWSLTLGSGYDSSGATLGPIMPDVDQVVILDSPLVDSNLMKF